MKQRMCFIPKGLSHDSGKLTDNRVTFTMQAVIKYVISGNPGYDVGLISNYNLYSRFR